MHFALLVQLIIPLVVRTVQPTIRYPVRANALIWVASGKPIRSCFATRKEGKQAHFPKSQTIGSD